MSKGAPATPATGYGMISVAEAQEIVLQESGASQKVTLKTVDALGYVVAADVVASNPLPPFPASIKVYSHVHTFVCETLLQDGYAVNSTDGPGEYPVEKSCFAGQSGKIQLQPKTVDYIATGAPVPDGADAVVQIEDTEFLGDRDGKDYVKIKIAAVPGLDIRPIGSDIEMGAQVVAEGDVVGVAEIGLLATLGESSVEVIKKPKVAVMSTGDELLDFDSTTDVHFGEIRDANRPMLLAACHERGFETIDVGIVKDDETETKNKIQAAISEATSVIICSGGVSMGSKDAVKPVLESMSTVHFGKVKMKPGKPLTFATIQSNDQKILFFGLPGNPVSSYACFQLFVLPALRKLQGIRNPLPRRIDVTIDAAIQLDPVRPEFARAVAQWKEGRFHAVTTGNQISSRLLSARHANVLLELPQGRQFGCWIPSLCVDHRRFALHVKLVSPADSSFVTNMTNRGCYVRLQREYKALKRDPVDNVTALPSPTNLLDWHFVIEGAKGTDYEGGYYHGKLMFTTDYPFRPPSILLLTPNGRFAINMKICMSMTDYHPESWNPVWSVGTILAGLLSFLHDTQATTGSITSASKKKKELAAASLEYNVRNLTFRKLFPDLVKKFEQQKESELLNQGKDPASVKKELEALKNGVEREQKLIPWDTNMGVIVSISVVAVAAAMMGLITVPYFTQ